MRKIWTPRVGIICKADSALALQRAQCPHEKIPVEKSLDGEEDFLYLVQENPCLGCPQPVCTSGRFSEV